MRWPPHLRRAAAMPRTPLDEVIAAAKARRAALRSAYRAAGLVGRAGVRVDYRTPLGAGSGEVLGVGKVHVAKLATQCDKFRRALGDTSGERGARR